MLPSRRMNRPRTCSPSPPWRPVEALAHAVASRQAERQHQFNVLVARELAKAVERIDDTWTIEDLVTSDEFLAGLTTVQRAASETASESKRQRLAVAATNCGAWAPFSEQDRELFLRLVQHLTDMQVWLLPFLIDNSDSWYRTDGTEEENSTARHDELTRLLGSKTEWYSRFAHAVDELSLWASSTSIHDTHPARGGGSSPTRLHWVAASSATWTCTISG